MELNHEDFSTLVYIEFIDKPHFSFWGGFSLSKAKDKYKITPIEMLELYLYFKRKQNTEEK